MANNKRAFIVSEETWIVSKEPPFVYDIEKYKDRKAVNVVIGIEEQQNGEVYIYEPIFKDILPLVFDKRVKVHVDLYSDPQVVLEKNGKIILHNGDIDYIKDVVDDALKTTMVSNQIRAITEIRMNQYNSANIGKTTKILRGNLSTDLERKLNYDFLRLYLREKYQLTDTARKSELAAQMSQYSKNELISLHGGIIEYREMSYASFEPLKGLLEQEYNFEDIVKAYREEVANRFYAGDIH